MVYGHRSPHGKGQGVAGILNLLREQVADLDEEVRAVVAGSRVAFVRQSIWKMPDMIAK